MSHEQPPSIFTETYRKYEALQDAYQYGYIDFHKFQDELANLEIQLDNGESWRLSEEGYWYWFDGMEWIQREPPKISNKPKAIEVPLSKPVLVQDEKKKKFPWALVAIPIVLIGLCVVIAVILYPLGVYDQLLTAIRGETQPTEIVEFLQEETPLNTSTPYPTDVPTPTKPTLVALSEHQQLVYDDFGWPDAFMIMEIDDLEGGQVRLETWAYYQGNIIFTFSDGIFKGEGEVETLPNNILPSPHHPDQFTLGFTIDQIQAILTDSPLILIEDSETIQEGVQIYAGQQLMLTFMNDRLIYVDALAFVPEGSEE